MWHEFMAQHERAQAQACEIRHTGLDFADDVLFIRKILEVINAMILIAHKFCSEPCESMSFFRFSFQRRSNLARILERNTGEVHGNF
jgi:hypothetical protein